MKFRTEINIQGPEVKTIDYHSKSLFLGSCFAEHFANRFDYYKLQQNTNPYGIMYNPVSIAQIFKDLEEHKTYGSKDLLKKGDLYLSLNHHSSWNRTNQDFLLSEINQEIKAFHEEMNSYSHVFISLGTAWVYKHKLTNQYVGNCHQLPADHFEKKLLDLNEIKAALRLIVSSFPETTQIGLTLSPVRHLKDGMQENNLSKSLLRIGIEEMLKEFSNTRYFPSFEILMDDLRDYRFYAKDMVHPSPEAIDYIWEKFQPIYFTKESLETMKKVKKVVLGLNHKAFNEDSQSHQKFLRNLEKEKKKLQDSLNIRF
ncbi:MAG: GSCFA domain-containing protein [Flavobacteriaceae bacterium]